MFRFLLIFTTVLFFFRAQANDNEACVLWFKDLKIKKDKDCDLNCRLGKTNMSTYMCAMECEKLCKDSGTSKDKEKYMENLYLTKDEIVYCEKNTKNCIEAYYLSWVAEQTCIEIYPKSDVNDESDACRHYIWAILLSQKLGSKEAKIILDAHENNPLQPQNQNAMDLSNNKLALKKFETDKDHLETTEQIKQSFLEEMKKKSVIVIKEKYKIKDGVKP